MMTVVLTVVQYKVFFSQSHVSGVSLVRLHKPQKERTHSAAVFTLTKRFTDTGFSVFLHIKMVFPPTRFNHELYQNGSTSTRPTESSSSTTQVKVWRIHVSFVMEAVLNMDPPLHAVRSTNELLRSVHFRVDFHRSSSGSTVIRNCILNVNVKIFRVLFELIDIIIVEKICKKNKK